MCCRSARMHDALGDALVVEMRDFLAEDVVFEQRGAARPDLEGVLIVGDDAALVGGERLVLRTGNLMSLAAERSPAVRLCHVSESRKGELPTGSTRAI